MTRITINCPTTWYVQCHWIMANCKDWVDDTCWSGWQIGFNDIHYWLRDEDAIEFLLRWS